MSLVISRQEIEYVAHTTTMDVHQSQILLQKIKFLLLDDKKKYLIKCASIDFTQTISFMELYDRSCGIH